MIKKNTLNKSENKQIETELYLSHNLPIFLDNNIVGNIDAIRLYVVVCGLSKFLATNQVTKKKKKPPPIFDEKMIKK